VDPPPPKSRPTALLPTSRGEGVGLGRAKAAAKELCSEKNVRNLKKIKNYSYTVSLGITSE